MRTLVHLSDLHFGKIDTEIVKPLRRAVLEVKPDVVVVSGDITHRARRSQFLEAKRFLSSLPFPKVVVPGNHDLPLYDVFTLMTDPLGPYREYISENTDPFYIDEEIAVLGLNTAWPLGMALAGRIDRQHRLLIERYLKGVDDSRTKIVVTHHPFELPEVHVPFAQLRVRGAKKAMAVLARCQADVFLSGHLHINNITDTAARYKIEGHNALIIQAAAAAAAHERRDIHSFNVLHIEKPRLSVTRHLWDEIQQVFRPLPAQHFVRGAAGWKRA